MLVTHIHYLTFEFFISRLKNKQEHKSNYNSCSTISSVNYLCKESVFQTDMHCIKINLKETKYTSLPRGILFFSERASIINESISLKANIFLGSYLGVRGHGFILIKY